MDPNRFLLLQVGQGAKRPSGFFIIMIQAIHFSSPYTDFYKNTGKGTVPIPYPPYTEKEKQAILSQLIQVSLILILTGRLQPVPGVLPPALSRHIKRLFRFPFKAEFTLRACAQTRDIVAVQHNHPCRHEHHTDNHFRIPGAKQINHKGDQSHSNNGTE